MEEYFLSNRLGEDTNQFVSKKEFETLKVKLDEDRKVLVNLDKTIQNLASSLNTIKTLIQKNTTKEESKKETKQSNDNSNNLNELFNIRLRKRKTDSIDGELTEKSDDIIPKRKKGI